MTSEAESSRAGAARAAGLARRLAVALMPALLALAAGAAVVFFVTSPYNQYEGVYALSGAGAPLGYWRVQVTYRPGQPRAWIRLQMDGLSNWRSVAYQIEWSVGWVPRWEGRLQGSGLGEYTTLDWWWLDTPYPMSAERAREAARSLVVTLQVDGEERVIDFRQAQFARPGPAAGARDWLWRQLCVGSRLIGG